MSQNSSSRSVTPGPAPCPAVGVPVVSRVLLCDVYRRTDPGYRGTATSLPGHLIQLTREGRTVHEANGRRYHMEAGDLIWYHEDELVRIHVLDAPWSFFTLNFIAPSLSPPPFEHRVRRVPARIRRLFEQLLLAWRNTTVSPAERELRVHARLGDLLAALMSNQAGPAARFTTDPSAELWWNLESRLRQDLSKPITLDMMAQLTGRSPATIARSCRAAVGVSPVHRIKQVRMSLARGLVQRSDLWFKEIAARVGFARIHEFSRDYRRWFGRSPREDRALARQSPAAVSG